MASVTLRKSTKYGTEPYVVLTVSQGEKDTAANRSYISWSLVIYRPSKVSSSASKSYSVTINGSTVKSGTTTIKGSGTKTIASGGLYVSHNTDGTKTLSFGATFNFGLTWSGTSIGTLSNSSSVVLSPIVVAANMSTLNIFNYEILIDGHSSLVVSSRNSSTNVTDTFSLTFGSHTVPLTSNVPFVIPMAWINEIPIDSKSKEATVTLTTKSGSTLIGTVTDTILLTMPESLGKPGLPSAIVTSSNDTTAIIQLVRPSSFQYGATFSNWIVSTEYGEIEITDDDIATLTRDPEQNVTIFAYVQAVDSRGFVSDPISIGCYARKKGFCVYDNGTWKQAVPYIYNADTQLYNKLHGAVYSNGKWNKVYYLGKKIGDYMLDEMGNILTDENKNKFKSE